MPENIYIITYNGKPHSAHREDPSDLLKRFIDKGFTKYCKSHELPRTIENKELYLKIHQWRLEETPLEEEG